MIPSSSKVIWLPVAVALVALSWRVAKLGFGVADPMPNFSPWLALSFAGAALMPRQAAWWIWPLLLVACDMLCQSGNMAEMWTVYACYGLAGLLGGALRKNMGALGIVGGTALASIGFYLLTSTQAWWISPVFSKTLTGWLQAITVGDPAYQPQAWVFAVRSLVSETGFALVLVAAHNAEAFQRRLAALPWRLARQPSLTSCPA
jgi:hypothetical protein